MARIEMKLSDDYVEVLNLMAEKANRTRKNFCETEMMKIIEAYIKKEKIKLPLVRPAQKSKRK